MTRALQCAVGPLAASKNGLNTHVCVCCDYPLSPSADAAAAAAHAHTPPQQHLTHGAFSYGAGPFIEELSGAINRINYNQNNTQLNALAGEGAALRLEEAQSAGEAAVGRQGG